MNRTIKYMLMLLIGCIEGGCNLSLSVEETAVVPIDEQPTVVAFLCPQDSIHTIRVGYTAPAIGVSNEARFIADLKKTTVQLSHNSQFVTMAYDSVHRLFYVHAEQFAVLAGHHYELSVHMPGRSPVKASCTIPTNTLTTQAITWTKANTTDSDGLQQYNFRWRDFLGEDNYYAFWRLTTFYDNRFNRSEVRAEQVQFQLTDQLLDHGYVVADPVSLPTRVNLGNGSFERTEVLICNTDQTYYNYHRTLSQLKQDNNPFSEPARMLSNIIGGYGVMAGYTRTKITFK